MAGLKSFKFRIEKPGCRCWRTESLVIVSIILKIISHKATLLGRLQVLRSVYLVGVFGLAESVSGSFAADSTVRTWHLPYLRFWTSEDTGSNKEKQEANYEMVKRCGCKPEVFVGSFNNQSNQRNRRLQRS